MSATSLLSKAKSYLPADRYKFVESALEYASLCHQGQARRTGQPYIDHPIATAEHLVNMRVDATTLAAAVLHDVVEDCGVGVETLESKFGHDVAKLVDGVTTLQRMALFDQSPGDTKQAGQPPSGDPRAAARAASTRKMLVAMAEDVRVILIKLADRLHNLRTLQALSAERQRRMAQETLDIYAPLAHRLGCGDLKWRLEDEAFRYLLPRDYRSISRLVARRREEREAYAQGAADALSAELTQLNINATVAGRPKHLYSIYRKMRRYADQGRQFDDIHDLIALRVIVDTEAACYAALGAAHSLWRPVRGRFDDYIANPKDNMYQSLHTSVIGREGFPMEVQIRTKEMHRLADDGVAAHWAYKEGTGADPEHDRFELRMSWLKQLLDWQREMHGDDEYLDSVKTDILRDQVFVFTPKGDVKGLPAGATPLDFAYLVHTEIGHGCVGAVVNGKLEPLNTPLKSGDTVEIRTSKAPRGPRLDWLNPNLGYLATARAKEKVRQWFRRQERAATTRQGREYLRKEMRRLSLEESESQVAEIMGFDSLDELLEALGTGRVGGAQIAEKVGRQRTAASAQLAPKPALVEPSGEPRTGDGVVVMGLTGMLTHIARCCNPVYGEEIVGYLTRGRGVTVHRATCPNVRSGDEPERIVEVAWGRSKAMSPVRVRLEAYDRVGLLRDITSILSTEHVNIHSMNTEHDSDNVSTVSFTVYTTGIEQLSRLFGKLEAIQGVHSIARLDTFQARV